MGVTTGDNMTGGEAIVAALEALEVDCVFGIPSQQNLGLYDALSRTRLIRVIGARHEAAAVHAADGYARATGRLGVAVVSTGPGTANAMNGLYEAQFASSPVLLITTQIPRSYLDRGLGFIHEAPGQLQMLQSVTRRTVRALNANELFGLIQDLAATALAGRPEPCALEVPTDLLDEPAEISHGQAVPRSVPGSDLEAVRDIGRRLAHAKRPLLWLGGGVLRGSNGTDVKRFVEAVGAPVVTSRNGRGAIPTDHPLFVTTATHYPQFAPLLEEADLVLAMGTRFQPVQTAYWTLPLAGKLAQIDVVPGMVGRIYPVLQGAVAELGLAIAELGSMTFPQVEAGWLERASGIATTIAHEHDQRLGENHVAICEAVDRNTPDDRIVSGDATMTANTWGAYRLSVKSFRSAMYSTSLAIGPGLPLAIGAAAGTGRRAIALHGDGGAMLHITELAAAVESCIPVTLLVFNDRQYGALSAIQKRNNKAHFGVDLHSPDFQALGRAMGVPS
jgi:acetolactate synthase-1/2/3 large subunit